jgi:hypothetical protein
MGPATFAQSGCATGAYMESFLPSNSLSPLVIEFIPQATDGLISATVWLNFVCAIITLTILILALMKVRPGKSVHASQADKALLA